VIFVVPRTGASLDVAELAAFIEKRIPEPPAKPRHIFVVAALPLTAVGKIFKPTLREQAVVEKLKLEIRKLDASVEIAGIRFEGDASGDPLAQIDLVKDSASLAPAMVELRLTEVFRDLTVKAAISWH